MGASSKKPVPTPMGRHSPDEYLYSLDELKPRTMHGFLQKRAGTSKIRWNIRWFEFKDGMLRWWRPTFREQVGQGKPPDVSSRAPVKTLDLRKLDNVVRTHTKKRPFSTTFKLFFKPEYTDYVLELRAEKEHDILDWYVCFRQFVDEIKELSQEREVSRERDVIQGIEAGLDEAGADAVDKIETDAILDSKKDD